MNKCDFNILRSEELKQLKELGFVEQDRLTEMYHTVLERTERNLNNWRLRAINGKRETEKRRDDKRTKERLENTVQGLRAIICKS